MRIEMNEMLQKIDDMGAKISSLKEKGVPVNITVNMQLLPQEITSEQANVLMQGQQPVVLAVKASLKPLQLLLCEILLLQPLPFRLIILRLLMFQLLPLKSCPGS